MARADAKGIEQAHGGFQAAQISLIVSAGRTSANLYRAHEGRYPCE